MSAARRAVGRQSVEVFGPKGSLEIVIPFNAPADEKTAILVGDGGPLDRSLFRREILPAVDQYTEQAETFALAVLGEKKLDFGVEDLDQPDEGSGRDFPVGEIGRLGSASSVRASGRLPTTGFAGPLPASRGGYADCWISTSSRR